MEKTRPADQTVIQFFANPVPPRAATGVDGTQ